MSTTEAYEVGSQDEENSETMLLGVIGAMKDGHCDVFYYKGIYVTNDNGQLSVNPEGPEAKVGASFKLLRSNTVNEIAEWVEDMAERYGDSS
jgi:hypothetical protein